MHSPATGCPGAAPAASLRHQLHRDREWEHRPPVDAVIAEVQVARQVERVEGLQRDLAAVRGRTAGGLRRTTGEQRQPGELGLTGSPARRRRRVRRPRKSGGRADHHLGLALAPAAQLLLEHPSALLEADQRDAAAGELGFQPGGDHARGPPRPPIDRHDPGGPAAIELVRELAEHLARGGVVGLATVAEAT